MKRYYDDCGYELYNDYEPDLRGGMDEYPDYWHNNQVQNLDDFYRQEGMVLHNGSWVMPHQVEDDNV
jgi:hypothetical protein